MRVWSRTQKRPTGLFSRRVCLFRNISHGGQGLCRSVEDFPTLMGRTLPKALAMAIILMAALSSPAWAAPLEVPAGYQLVWSDEFDTDGLPDPGKWAHETSRNREGWHNNERQYYSSADGHNAIVRGGRLIITARRESTRGKPDSGGQAYTSARLITRGKAAWTYGFFEIRAKMPCGQGTWPAIWALGTGGQWPDDGELDIMEHVGSKPDQVSSAVHMAIGHGGQGVTGIRTLNSACTEFNRYQMLWTPQHVFFGVNGEVHLVFPKMDAGKRAWPFDEPSYLLLNLAIGGDLGGPVDDRIFPVSMEVDYVRVYQAPAGKSDRP